MRRCLGLLMLAVLFVAGVASALNGPAGIICPTGNNPTSGVDWAEGDTYHLVFVTSTKTNLVGDHPMPYWNRYVNWVADISGVPSVAAASWYCLACTWGVNATDNPVVSAPVYLMNGSSIVATGYSDLWTGSISNRITIDEKSNGGYSGYVWTGSGGTKPLDVFNGNTQTGAITGNGGWFGNRDAAETVENRFYVMSQLLRIADGAGDTTPPSPTNMSFAVAPIGNSAESVEMYATVAYDLDSTPVEYYFENETTGENSGWQVSTYWCNDVKARSVYSYRVKARDAMGNETAWSESHSSSATLYGDYWAPAPTGINPTSGLPWKIGDTYQLAFQTSSSTNVVGDHDIAFWNNYIDSVAASSSLTGMADVVWYVIGSTKAVNAKENAVVSAPVYLLSRDAMDKSGYYMVASGYDDMWDGLSSRIVIDENGNQGNYTGWRSVWTGSNNDGNRANNLELDSTGNTACGDPAGNWMNNGNEAETSFNRFYALSERLEIMYPPPPAGTVLILR